MIFLVKNCGNITLSTQVCFVFSSRVGSMMQFIEFGQLMEYV